jgi:hypothetical protein
LSVFIRLLGEDVEDVGILHLLVDLVVGVHMDGLFFLLLLLTFLLPVALLILVLGVLIVIISCLLFLPEQ